MKRLVLVCLSMWSFVGIAACAGFFMPADTRRPQAAFDLQCPQNQIQMTELSGDCGKKLATNYDCTLGVHGCGKQTTYSHVPKTNTWVANAPHQ
jgi:hypothetical protein